MKKLKIQNPITPNRLLKATAELKSNDLGNYVIPTEIQEAEKDYYVCICINADVSDRMNPKYSAIQRFLTRREWDRQTKEMKKDHPIFTAYFANSFDKVVVLHNPTLDMAPPIKTKKQIAAEKKQVKAGKEKAKKDKEDLGKENEGDEKIKGLSPKQKKQVNDLMEAGKGQDDDVLNAIADEIGIDFDRVKAYIMPGIK